MKLYSKPVKPVSFPLLILTENTTSIQKSICFRSFNGFFDSINDLGIVLSIIPIKRKAEVGKQKKLKPFFKKDLLKNVKNCLI